MSAPRDSVRTRRRRRDPHVHGRAIALRRRILAGFHGHRREPEAGKSSGGGGERRRRPAGWSSPRDGDCRRVALGDAWKAWACPVSPAAAAAVSRAATLGAYVNLELVGAASIGEAGRRHSAAIGGTASRPGFLRSRWWARLGSNQRPLACEASALPLSYAPNIPQLRPGCTACQAGERRSVLRISRREAMPKQAFRDRRGTD